MDTEKELREQLGIHLVHCKSPQTLPEHLLKTFQQIESFKEYSISTYSTNDPTGSSQLVWRNKTKARARKIARTANATNEAGDVSEMELRLRLEELALARFRLKIYCPSCEKRTWRSEVEVIVEKPGIIAESLVELRKGRSPCRCRTRQELLDKDAAEVDKIFSSKADQFVLYDAFKGSVDNTLDTSSIRRRRPDRIMGFQETESFDNRLSEIYQRQLTQIARQVHNDAGNKSIREMMNCSIHNYKSGPLLFPFLAMEAKSAKGKSFTECIKQCAFPIWMMLRIQEELHDKSKIRLEHGGPLIWYIAYRGHEWRVSGCYTVKKNGKTSYEINELWRGLINDEDKALQLLLIIDYIFDWARDVYRASILNQLKALAESTDAIEEDNDATQIATEIDIQSRRGSWQSKSIGGCIDATEGPPQYLLDAYYNHELWGKLDCINGVFRPACLIESVFQCVYVTKDNVHKLYASVPTSHIAKKLAKQANEALEINSVVVSEQILMRMEEIWTNKTRQQLSQDVRRENIFATIVYHTRITENWELERSISCLAFDEEALRLFRQYSGQTTPHPALQAARKLSERNAEDLLQDLHTRTIQYNLAAALAEKKNLLRTVAGTSSSNQYPTFEFFAQSDSRSTSIELDVTSQIYSWSKSGPEEQEDTYIRFSRQANVVPNLSGERAVSSYFPGAVSLENEDYILVAYEMVPKGSWHRKNILCLYSVKDCAQPPSQQELARALQNACRDDIFYHTGRNGYNGAKFVYQKLTTAKFHGVRKILNATREWQNELSQFLSTTGPSKSPNLEPQSQGNAVTAEHDSSSGNAQVLELPVKVSTAPGLFEEPKNKSVVHQPSRRVSGYATPEVARAEGRQKGTAMESVMSCYQKFIAQGASRLLLKIANAESQSAAECSKQANYLSSHLTPDRDLSNVHSVHLALHTHSTQNNSLTNASLAIPLAPASPMTPPASPGALVESTRSAPPTGLTSPFLSPIIKHATLPSSSKRGCGDDLKVGRTRKRLKISPAVVDKEVKVID